MGELYGNLRILKLYWVTNEDHEEDWFVAAICAKEAAKFHEDMKGYDPGDAIAESILDISEEIPAEIGWPPDEILKAFGATFICENPSRVVEISGRKFCEGLMDATIRLLDDDDVFEILGHDRIIKTPIKSTHQFAANYV